MCAVRRRRIYCITATMEPALSGKGVMKVLKTYENYETLKAAYYRDCRKRR